MDWGVTVRDMATKKPGIAKNEAGLGRMPFLAAFLKRPQA
jgi:hypothetical protein